MLPISPVRAKMWDVFVNRFINEVTSVCKGHSSVSTSGPTDIQWYDCRWRVVPAPFMMTSSNGTIFRVTGHLCGVFTGHRGEFPAQRSVTRSFDFFSDLHLNKHLSKQWWGDLRRYRAHYGVTVMFKSHAVSSNVWAFVYRILRR